MDLVILLISLIISMVIHEFMHGFVAFKLGDTTAMEHGRLSFNPLKHIDPFMTIILPAITLIVTHFPLMAAKPVPFDPSRVKFDDYGAAMVAAAGPLSNLVLAILAVLISIVLPINSFISNALVIFIQLNVALFVFNLVPIPPLDGSRVVYAFAPDVVRNFFDAIEPFGFFIILALLYFNRLNIIFNIDQMVLNVLSRL